MPIYCDKLNLKLNNIEIFNKYTIKTQILYNLLYTIENCIETRKLPNYTLSMGKTQSEIFLSAFLDTETEIITHSKLLCDDIMILAINAQMSAIYNCIDNYYIITLIKKDDFLIKPDNINFYNYNGFVACLEVRTNVFMVRQNNKSVWSGNCSRYGQKSTIGILLSETDMPFNSKGLYPDIIINPNAIPGRMTMAHIIEKIVGKVSAIKGIDADGTAFKKYDYDFYQNELEKLGYTRDGTEYLICGMTGKKMNNPIYIGPIYYERLKHLSSDKIHARNTGKTTLLTRQPSEGRGNDGGFRIGEMERDALISHGLSLFLKERLLDSSDIYQTFVCDICGLFAQRIKKVTNKIHPQSFDLYECKACKNKTKISKVILPYACKLFFQELLAMNIAPRMKMKEY